MNLMRRKISLGVLFLVLACAKTHGFFAKARNNLHRLPTWGIGRNYCNDTTTGKSLVPSIFRPDVKLEAIPQSTTKNHEDRKKDHAKSLQKALRKVVSLVRQFCYSVKVHAAMVAIQVVLSLQMEGPVLRRLPPHLLLFLLQVSVRRPEVLQSVANELGQRLAQEIQSLTGQEEYQVGDITKAIVSRYTGKQEYHFGDLTTSTMEKMKCFFLRTTTPTTTPPQSNQHHHLWHQYRQGILGNPQEEWTCSSLESILYKVTGKKEYEFGNVTKAVLKQLQSLPKK